MKALIGFPLIFALFYMVAAGLILGVSSVDSGGLRVHFVDVGQGDAIFIEMNGQPVALIDGGADYTADDYILKQTGLNCYIPLAVLTHAHDDHFVGFKRIWERCKFGMARYNDVDLSKQVLPENEKYIDKNKVKKTFDGEQFVIKDVFIKMLVPYGNIYEMPENINNASVAVFAKYKDFEGLFLGDLELEAQRRLDLRWLSKMTDGRLDVLKIAHHGAKNGFSKTLVAYLKPRVCVISVGADNKFGHPSPSVVEGLEEAGCGVVRTDKVGSIVIQTR